MNPGLRAGVMVQNIHLNAMHGSNKPSVTHPESPI